MLILPEDTWREVAAGPEAPGINGAPFRAPSADDNRSSVGPDET
jgi:hypothetical protein